MIFFWHKLNVENIDRANRKKYETFHSQNKSINTRFDFLQLKFKKKFNLHFKQQSCTFHANKTYCSFKM